MSNEISKYKILNKIVELYHNDDIADYFLRLIKIESIKARLEEMPVIDKRYHEFEKELKELEGKQ